MDGFKNTDRFAKSRERMLKQDLEGRDITDPRVLKVMAEIPREKFRIIVQVLSAVKLLF